MTSSHSLHLTLTQPHTRIELPYKLTFDRAVLYGFNYKSSANLFQNALIKLEGMNQHALIDNSKYYECFRNIYLFEEEGAYSLFSSNPNSWDFQTKPETPITTNALEISILLNNGVYNLDNPVHIELLFNRSDGKTIK